MKFAKFAAWLLGSALLATVLCFAYLAATMIDETVTEGAAYGFTIGATKADAFKLATTAFADGPLFIREARGRSGEPRIGQRVPLRLAPESFTLLEDQDVWEFFFDEGDPDYLRLTFESGQLAEIRRHRQYFELL